MININKLTALASSILLTSLILIFVLQYVNFSYTAGKYSFIAFFAVVILLYELMKYVVNHAVKNSS